MGVGVYLFLIDKNKYDSEVVPAFENFDKNQDSKGLINLFEEILDYAKTSFDEDIYIEMYQLGHQIFSSNDTSFKEKKDFLKCLDIAGDFCRDKRFRKINFAKTYLSRHFMNESEILSYLVMGGVENFSNKSLKYFGEFNRIFDKKGSKLLSDELNSLAYPIDEKDSEELTLLKEIAKESLKNDNLKILFVVE